MRAITVFSSKINKKKNISSTATTWGELRTEIQDLLTETMSATILPSKLQLVDAGAILPTGEFTLILKPTSTKSGAKIEIDTTVLVSKIRQRLSETFTRFLDDLENDEANDMLGLEDDKNLEEIANNLD